MGLLRFVLCIGALTFFGRTSSAQSQRHYIVETMTLVKDASITYDEFGLPNKKSYFINLCLSDTSRNRASQIQVSISDGRSARPNFTTDLAGCFQWSEVFYYNHKSKEQFFVVSRLLRSNRFLRPISFSFYLNPWTDQLRPSSNGKPFEVGNTFRSTVPFNGQLKVGPQNLGSLGVTQMDVQFLGHDYNQYSIDDRLSLYIAHTYRIQVKPHVLREGLLTRYVAEPVNTGSINVDLLFFSEKRGTSENVSFPYYIGKASVKLKVDPATGFARGLFNLRTFDLLSSLRRVKLVFRISSPSAAIHDSTYTATISPLAANAMVANKSNIPFQKLADKMNDLRYRSLLKEYSSFQLAERFFGLRLLDPSILERELNSRLASCAGFSRDQKFAARKFLNDWMNGEKSKSSTCEALAMKYGMQTFLAQKLQVPLRLIEPDVRPLYFVQSVDTKSLKSGLSQAPQTLSVSYTVTDSRTVARSAEAKLTAQAQAQLDLSSIIPAGGQSFSALAKTAGVTPQLGIKGGAEASVSSTYVVQNVKSYSEKFELSLKAQERSFSFRARYKPCLYIQLLPPAMNSVVDFVLKNQTMDRYAGLNKRFVICSTKMSIGELKESYTFVSEDIPTDVFIDGENHRENRLSFLVRGRAKTQVLMNFLKEPSLSMYFEKVNLEKLTLSPSYVRSRSPWALQNQILPGAYEP